MHFIAFRDNIRVAHVGNTRTTTRVRSKLEHKYSTCSKWRLLRHCTRLSVEVDSQVSILDMGVKFSYRVPSFSVLHVDLRQIKFQLTAEGCVMLFDGFILADPELDMKSAPFSLKLKDYCFVPVSVCECVCVCACACVLAYMYCVYPYVGILVCMYVICVNFDNAVG